MRLAMAAVMAGVALAQRISAPADAKEKVDRIFEKYQRTDSPGCVVGATIDGATVLSTAYGMADLEHNVPLTPDSVLEPGSIAKQFTAGAILLLAQQGRISLDDPVRKYIPEVPEYDQPITIRQMINHTSGLRDWGNVEAIAGWPRTSRTYTHANVLEIVSRQKALNYKPGEYYSYSNTGFNLAAIVVSRVSNKPFPEFTRDAIFRPMGMASTQWRDDFQRIVKNRAVAYQEAADQEKGGQFRMLMPFENVFGNGGLLTTAGDLLRWNRNFTEMKVGGEKFVEAQLQQGKLNNGQTIAYAAGLMALKWRGLREVSHSGSTAGYQAWLGRYPDQGLSVAVLCNVASARATALGHHVADVYLSGVISTKDTTPEVRLDQAGLQRLAGIYASDRDHETVLVEVKDQRLQMGRREMLKAVSQNAFLIGEDGPRAEFEAGAEGKVKRLRILSDIDGWNYYDKKERASPTEAELEKLAGEYSSEEAEVVLKVAVEGDGLVIHRRPNIKIELFPNYQDMFSSALGSVRFIRDPGGRVVEMSVGDSRVCDLRFHRVPHGG
jgi:CubicO group peptidase (beta-lactamase class C family)